METIEKTESLDRRWQEKAHRELNECDEIRNLRLEEFRRMLKGSQHDDLFLLRFLRARKFDVEKAHEMLKKYKTMKTESETLFKVSPVTDMKFMLEMQIQLMLPINDDFGKQVYLFRIENLDPHRVPVDYVFRSNILAFETSIRDSRVQIGGVVIVLDMAGVRFSHARYLSPHLARRTVEVVQEAFPLRFKAFHVLNEPFYFNAVLSMLKPFLKEKIRRRIFTHGTNLASLHNHVPKEVLPKEYGGSIPFDNTAWRDEILRDSEYYENLEKQILGYEPSRKESFL